MEHKRDNGHVDLPRFRMEQPVDPASVEMVTELLPGLSRGLVVINPHRYHSTIVSLARAGTIFSILRREVPGLAQEYYAQEMLYLRERLALIQSDVMEVPGERFDIYGNGQRVFVLKLRLIPELRELHEQAYEEVSRWLRRCGISTIGRFMEGVYGLHYSTPERFKPHVSLAKGMGKKRPPVEAKDIAVVLYPAKVVETRYARVHYHE